jgi:hypothetical protein
VWHPHEGFRAGAIRNRGVEVSTGGYLIFLDGAASRGHPSLRAIGGLRSADGSSSAIAY